jgi:hypothetical protein
MERFVLIFKQTVKETGSTADVQFSEAVLEKTFRQYGVEFLDMYKLPGHCDTMVIANAPDEISISNAASNAGLNDLASISHPLRWNEFSNLMAVLP